ncbi:MAG: hypothetical protein JEY94_15515 [Melioribacteraceae bacterium]|nr:hypothetical protein [Melioribacteraceae bacterium]
MTYKIDKSLEKQKTIPFEYNDSVDSLKNTLLNIFKVEIHKYKDEFEVNKNCGLSFFEKYDKRFN